MKTLRFIDIKSALIGFLLCAIFFFGVAATSSTDKWDAKQEWLVASSNALFGKQQLEQKKMDGMVVYSSKGGWEPFQAEGGTFTYRKRIK
jgi:hypothetical protein|tara:strand:+ start:309 stop:578 length:270 start_codon:yes stop_codon:yes gene_type:complete